MLWSSIQLEKNETNATKKNRERNIKKKPMAVCVTLFLKKGVEELGLFRLVFVKFLVFLVIKNAKNKGNQI